MTAGLGGNRISCGFFITSDVAHRSASYIRNTAMGTIPANPVHAPTRPFDEIACKNDCIHDMKQLMQVSRRLEWQKRSWRSTFMPISPIGKELGCSHGSDYMFVTVRAIGRRESALIWINTGFLSIGLPCDPALVGHLSVVTNMLTHTANL
jgi:hypothetical protein